MVPNPRFDDSMTDANIPHVSFDGSPSSNNARFLFVLYNVVTRGRADSEQALQITHYPEEAAFSFYYESFQQKDSLTESACKYNFVKKKLLAEFEKKAKVGKE